MGLVSEPRIWGLGVCFGQLLVFGRWKLFVDSRFYVRVLLVERRNCRLRVLGSRIVKTRKEESLVSDTCADRVHGLLIRCAGVFSECRCKWKRRFVGYRS